MGLPALVSVSEFGTYLNTSIPENDARAVDLLQAASAQVRSVVGVTWADATGQFLGDVPELAKLVVKAAAARGWANPTGASGTTAGPFSATWGNNPSVLLTEDEKETLQTLVEPVTGGGIPGLSSVRVVAPRSARGISYSGYSEDEDC